MPDGRSTTAINRPAARRLDSKLLNGMSGMGIPGQDVAENTQRRRLLYTIHQARQDYRGSFAARREINTPAEALIAQGIELSDLPPSVDPAVVLDYLDGIGADGLAPEDRGALQALSLLHATMNKVAGAVAIMVIEDGLEPWEPVDFTRIEDLLAIEILERDEVQPWAPDGNLGRAEFYVLGGARSSAVPSQIVHRSRVIVGVGMRLGPKEEALNNGWGASQLELLKPEREAMHSSWQELTSMMLKSQIDIIHFAELAEMLCETTDAGGDTGRVAVEERTALLAKARSQHKLMPLDGGRQPNPATNEAGRNPDQFTQRSMALRGAQDLAIAQSDHWAGATGQTPSIALGRQGPGFNTGANEGDARSFDARNGAEQATWLKPRIEIVLDVAFAARNGPTGGRIPPTYTVSFPPTFRPTELESAQAAQAWAAVDAAYVVMTPEIAPLVVEQRMVQGNTGMLTLVLPTVPELVEGEPLPEEELELDALEQAWSDAAPPADAGTSTELAALDELAGKVTAHGITRMANDGVLTIYKDFRRGHAVPVYSLRDVKAVLLGRGGVEYEDPDGELEEELEDEGARHDAKPRRGLFGWLRRR